MGKLLLIAGTALLTLLAAVNNEAVYDFGKRLTDWGKRILDGKAEAN